MYFKTFANSGMLASSLQMFFLITGTIFFSHMVRKIFKENTITKWFPTCMLISIAYERLILDLIDTRSRVALLFLGSNLAPQKNWLFLGQWSDSSEKQTLVPFVFVLKDFSLHKKDDLNRVNSRWPFNKYRTGKVSKKIIVTFISFQLTIYKMLKNLNVMRSHL